MHDSSFSSGKLRPRAHRCAQSRRCGHANRKSPFTFTFQDFQAYETRRESAGQNVKPVYLHKAELKSDLGQRVREAFAGGRSHLDGLGEIDPGLDEVERQERLRAVANGIDELDRRDIGAKFLDALAVHLPDAEVATLLTMGFDRAVEDQAVLLIEHAMDRLIISNMNALPESQGAITVIELRGMVRAEDVVTDLSDILDLDGARQLVSIKALESKSGSALERQVDARSNHRAGAGSSQPCLESLETEERRRAAEAAEPLQVESVKRGTILFRQGDVLTEQDLLEYEALRSFKTEHPFWMEVLSIGVFIFPLLGCSTTSATVSSSPDLARASVM